MIKAVLFDMNGVIIDDEHLHEMAFRETVKPFGIDLTHQLYLECCAGKTDRDGYESIPESFSVELPIDKLLAEKNRRYAELFPENKKSYDGVLELIESLSKNFTLALTSSSSRAEVDLITNELDVRRFFKITISANEVNKGKPHPEPYLTTAKLLKLKPEKCVAIEDSRSGVSSAKAAGCYCIGVTTTHEEEDLGEADLVVSSFSEIDEEVINKINK
ncbi:MAG: HAD family phosphatase [Candidatus Pacebacteria bacterium]|jgi:HAD superfamily hydrolase (TIGR01509 family)|nr:HAD family phosphatase [Candidatus Paceibacterota bacterium]MBT3512330.1 HAD family phosphatase [Candidatus Paceibacterota bacterium]MBT4004690.1 HAD family phosphatase [Candidatus Paceibacterota bacterium]MBT4358391.1 HAD family phosphatase [Candidatus Paceibacterota bacterium]MBT4680826.1 HAD family phosphatase [Candidatus Paceibacterota bacterium]